MKEQQIGHQLKELRKARGFQQSYVAEKLNMSRSAISNIENGRRSLTLSTLKKFADFYKIDVSYFEIDSKKDTVIDLIERSKKIFNDDNVPKDQKEQLYLEIMQLYLELKKNI